MSETPPPIQLRTSPHIRQAPQVNVIMRNVALALLPVCAFSVLQFGLSALAVILTATASCMATEHVFCRISKKASTLSDWSAAVTGLLLGLILPPGFPLWMTVVAGIFSIAVGKLFFGGLGYNVMNPALVGRAFAQAAFTVPITTWTPGMAHNRFLEFIPSTLTLPFCKPPALGDWIASLHIDGYTGATPLALMKFDHITTDPIQLFLGTIAGSAGETSSLIIVMGGLYLAFRKMLNWKIPVAVLSGAFITSGAFYLLHGDLYPDPFFTLFSGGLMLGAVFMATDMVSSPVTPVGIWIYGLMIGIITVVIRLFGGLNEGVMYAILLANAAAPLLNAMTQPRRYGAPPRKKKEAQA